MTVRATNRQWKWSLTFRQQQPNCHSERSEESARGRKSPGHRFCSPRLNTKEDDPSLRSGWQPLAQPELWSLDDSPGFSPNPYPNFRRM